MATPGHDIILTAKKLDHLNSRTKRKLNLTSWVSTAAKIARNSGKEYKMRNGRTHPAIPDPNQQAPCGERCENAGCLLSSQRKLAIHEEFWNLGTYDLENSVILRLMRRKSATRYEYTLLDESGYHLDVCRRTFLDVLGITEDRLRVLHGKVQSGSLFCKDGRGRHENRPNRLTPEVLQSMTGHIDSFPKERSHYCRNDGDPLREYLPLDLNVSKMFRLFLEQHGNEAKTWQWMYRQICREKQLRFGEPRSDTCSTCDRYKVQLGALNEVIDAEQYKEIESKAEQHHTQAEGAYAALRADESRSKQAPDDVTICVDLQGILLSPTLTNSEYFYLRKFTSYNFCVVDLGAGKTTMHFWNSTDAGRGSCEIASCIWNYITTSFQPLAVGEIRTLNVWSDRCTGQNNNFLTIAIYRCLIAKGYFTEIRQKFLTTGHSFLPADRQFALIEKYKKTTQVYFPNDWMRVLREANVEKPFAVTHMTQEHFKDLKRATAVFKWPDTLKVTEVKSIMLRKDAADMIFTKREVTEQTWVVHHTFDADQPLANLRFGNLFSAPRPLSAPVLKDVKSLLQWVPAEHRNHWNFLDMITDDDESQENEIIRAQIAEENEIRRMEAEEA